MICQEGSGACQHPNMYIVAYIAARIKDLARAPEIVPSIFIFFNFFLFFRFFFDFFDFFCQDCIYNHSK